MNQQHPNTSTSRPTTKEEEYEHSSTSTSTATEAEKEAIAANALNEGATAPVQEEQEEQIDGGNVEKQVTRRSVLSSKPPSVNNVSAIPNGGTRAWLQVLGAFFLFFNSWGIINTVRRPLFARRMKC